MMLPLCCRESTVSSLLVYPGFSLNLVFRKREMTVHSRILLAKLYDSCWAGIWTKLKAKQKE